MNECGWLLMNPSLAGERCDEKKRTEKRREKREKIPILGRGRDTTMLARHVQLRKMSFSIDHWMTSEWRIDCEWMGMKGKMYEWFNYILVTTSASKNLCKSKNTRITLTSHKTNLILEEGIWLLVQNHIVLLYVFLLVPFNEEDYRRWCWSTS